MSNVHCLVHLIDVYVKDFLASLIVVLHKMVIFACICIRAR